MEEEHEEKGPPSQTDPPVKETSGVDSGSHAETLPQDEAESQEYSI